MSSASDQSGGGLETGTTPGGSIGKRVGSGVSLNVVQVVVLRVVSFLAQIELARHLSHDDFGLNATAVSAAMLAGAFRDAGTPEWLVQRGMDEYRRSASSCFWLSLTVNTVLAMALLAAAPVSASILNQPKLPAMFLCVALSIPLSAPGAIQAAKLRMELRLKAVSWVYSTSALIRYAGAVVFAMAGFGALSFVLPMPIASLFESIFMYVAVKETPWKGTRTHGLGIGDWRGFLVSTRWIMIGGLSIAVLSVGDYAALAWVLPPEEVGVYFFAFQLVSMTGAVLAHNIGKLMYPALAALREQPDRLKSAMYRCLCALMLLSAPASVGVGAVIDPVEAIFWKGQWDPAVLPVLVFALTYPIRAVIVVPQVTLMAIGRFRGYAFYTMMIGVVCMVASVVVAMLAPADDRPAWIALGVGIVRSAACGLVLIVTARAVGLSFRMLFESVVPAWLASLLAAAGAVALDRVLVGQVTPLLRAIIAGAVFAAAYGGLCRVAIPGIVDDALAVLPAGLTRPARVLLRLPMGPPPASSEADAP